MKVLLVIAALAALALAEPPAPNQNTYLPPNRNQQQYDSYNDGSHNQQYSSPSQQYGAPQQQQQYNAPSQQYGAPFGNGGNGAASNARNTYAPPTHRVSLRLGNPSSKSGRNGGYAAARTPSAQYGAPNGGARSQFAAAPSNQYSTPSFNSAPSGQFGAPARSFNSAPSSQYGAPAPSFNSAPSSQYGAPAPSFNSAPSSQYGAPAPSFNSAPSSQYGAPASSFNSAPSSQYGAPAPSSQYGAPAPSFNSAPSSQYGAPAPSFNSAPSSQYGAPAASTAVASFNSAPSSQYGAPARSSPSNFRSNGQNGHSNGQNGHSSAAARTASSQYGFGARNTNGQFASHASAPSSQYSAPQRSAAPSSTYGTPSQSSFQAPSVEIGRSNGFGRQSHSDSYAASAPQQQYVAPSAQYGAPNARSAATEDPLAEPASYEYTYDVNDSASGSDFGHKEGRDGEVTTGEYRVLLPDGRTQVVKYEADENGYKPQIEYEEASSNGANGYPASRNQGGPY